VAEVAEAAAAAEICRIVVALQSDAHPVAEVQSVGVAPIRQEVARVKVILLFQTFYGLKRIEPNTSHLIFFHLSTTVSTTHIF
jgi:hypothetical protein